MSETLAEKQRRLYWANPAKRRERNRAYVARARLKLIKEFGGHCARCGSADVSVLEFDHIHNDGMLEKRTQNKNYGRSNGGRSTLAKVKKDRTKFQLLCKTCNIKKRNDYHNFKRQLVIISWLDHTSDSNWLDIDKFHKPALIHSIGWIFKEDAIGITLAACWGIDEDGDQTASNTQYILKGCVVERQHVKFTRNE